MSRFVVRITRRAGHALERLLVMLLEPGGSGGRVR